MIVPAHSVSLDILRSKALGVYPGDKCYDPTRPSWLPYWLDTNSENLCRFGVYPTVTTLAPVPPPPMPAGPGAPQTQEQMTVPGAYTPEQSAADQAAANAAQFQTFMNNLAASPDFAGTKSCDTTSQSWIDPSTWCADHWLIAGIGGLGIALLMFGSIRR
jgi:hypothetical protein